MTWRVAKSLDVILKQVNDKWPARDKSYDGALGDEAHAARESDHNPDTDDVVKARDITHDPAHGFDSYAFADMLLRNKDERIKYVISNRRIASGTGQDHPAWVWRPYDKDPHDHHVHISVKRDAAHYDDTRPWNIGPFPPWANTPVATDTFPPTLQRGSHGDDVRRLQTILFVDGVFGPLTTTAVLLFQKRNGLDGDGIVGPDTWRELLKVKPAISDAPPPDGSRQVGITATVFGGASDVNKSAYTGRMLNDDDLYVALPDRIDGARPLVWVENAVTGQRVDNIQIEDVGPWNIDDDYWTLGKRPQSESGTDARGRKTNLAGIDLSPALARRLGISGKGKVNWGFVTSATTAPAKPTTTWMDFDIWAWVKSLFK